MKSQSTLLIITITLLILILTALALPEWRPAILLIALIDVVLTLALKFLPEFQVSPLKKNLTPNEQFTFKNEARRTVIQGITALGLFATILFTAWNTRLTQQGQQLTQDIAQRTLQMTQESAHISRETEITNRFTQATQNLGSDKLEVRLGAIYSLERIAKDSADDHWQVMEILTALLREHAPYHDRDESPFIRKLVGEMMINEERASPPAESSAQAIPPTISPIEIEAVLTVLRRRNWQNEVGKGQYLDLHSTNLANANLQGIHLEGANLSGAKLEKAYFERAFLSRANFERADLSGASFVGTDLEDATLRDTLLTNAYFAQANLSGVSFEAAVLDHAMLAAESLDRVNFGAASLKDVFFGDADLQTCIIQWEQLEQVGYLDKRMKVPPDIESLWQSKLKVRKEYLKNLRLSE